MLSSAPNDEGERPVERKLGLVEHVVQRASVVSRNIIAVVAYVIAAHRDLRLARAVIEGGTQAQRARPPGHGLEPAHQHGRTEHAPEAAEARRKIPDTRRAARAVDRRFRDRRIGNITLAAVLHAVDDDIHETRLRIVAAQQRIEDRIAVQPAQTVPDVAAEVAIDQARDGTVSDDAEIERAHAETRRRRSR